MEIFNNEKSKVSQALFIFLCILVAYFAVGIISELKTVSYIGESATPATISFNGHGEVTAVPDIANVSFTISKDASTVASAQAAVATVEKNALDFLKSKGVADADIQTSDASFNPKYQYTNTACPISVDGGASYPCGGGKQTLVGYTASESITVKVRNTDDAGAIMQGLGTVGATDLSGPNFTIDNPSAVQEQARQKAIADAQTQAKSLAKDLGVSLGKITSFSENGNYPQPIMYNAMAKGMAVPASAPAVIPVGQNTITSDVTITYEIR